jgi:glycosyltransferase involved in cell wall biosynthesis
LESYAELLPTVDHKTSIEYLFSSDALLLLIPNSMENKGILTGKLFEYLGSKKPIIGIGPQNGDAAKIITDCDSGKMIQFGDVEALCDYLNQLYEKWENSCLPVSNKNVEKYSRQTLAGLLSKEIINQA